MVKVSKYLIYALVDPRTLEWRYVGRSSSGMIRPKQHIKPRLLKKKSRKNSWIISLKTLGLRPIIDILEEFDSFLPLNVAEIEWIAEAKRCGCKLTNMTDGGDGVNGYCPTLEQRQKSSKNRKGIPVHTEEFKRMMSKLKTGVKFSAENKLKNSIAH